MAVLDKIRKASGVYEKNGNCAQAVLLPYAEEMGLSDETAGRIIKGYAQKMEMSMECGALLAALMVISFYYSDDGEEELLQMKTRETIQIFEQEYGSIYRNEIRNEFPACCGHCKMLIKDMILIIENQIRDKRA